MCRYILAWSQITARWVEKGKSRCTCVCTCTQYMYMYTIYIHVYYTSCVFCRVSCQMTRWQVLLYWFSGIRSTFQEPALKMNYVQCSHCMAELLARLDGSFGACTQRHSITCIYRHTYMYVYMYIEKPCHGHVHHIIYTYMSILHT